ncbi:MAG: hypothetical protein JNM31_05780 [Flavobacteriales bacterium]|nr:hypothetical protein [Flavobacteriales bacterium]
MIRQLPLLLLFGTGSILQAQQAPETRYLFAGPLHVSGAGGLLMQGGSIDAFSGISGFMGGGGGVLFSQRLLVGGYGMGLTTQVERNIFFTDRDRALKAELSFGHGGFWFQYSAMPHKPVHPVVGLQLGWGAATWDFDDDQFHTQDNPAVRDIEDRVFVITPTLGCDLNITPWFRPTILAGYRYVDGLSLPQTDADELDGFFLSIALLFGGFGGR